MSGKASFAPTEWSRVVASPFLAGMAITAADPSGLWGLAKEGMASGWALLAARQDAQANPLAKAVADDFGSSETRSTVQAELQAKFKGGKPGDLREKAIAELRAVAALIDAKAPEDAAGFKAWLRDVAQQTAEAAKEGGFLGFGGVPVSEAEKVTLAEITAALGHLTSTVDTPSPNQPSHTLAENAPANLDEKLDSAVDESFPASDPVSVRITK